MAWNVQNITLTIIKYAKSILIFIYIKSQVSLTNGRGISLSPIFPICIKYVGFGGDRQQRDDDQAHIGAPHLIYLGQCPASQHTPAAAAVWWHGWYGM